MIIIAIVLIVAGLFFFARSLGFVDEEAFGVIWPLLLVVVGLSLLSHHKGEKGWWNEVVFELGKPARRAKKKRT